MNANIYISEVIGMCQDGLEGLEGTPIGVYRSGLEGTSISVQA